MAGALSSVAISLSSDIGQFVVLLCSSVLLGVSMISMNVAWGVIVVAQGARKAVLNTAGSWTVGFLINTIVQGLIPVAQEVVVALFPLVSMGLYALNASLQGRKQYRVAFIPIEEGRGTVPRSVVRTSFVVLIFCLSFGLMYGMTIFILEEGSSVSVFGALGMRGFGAFILLVAGLLLPRKRFSVLVSAFVLLVMLGVVLVPVQLIVGGLEDVVCLTISLGYVGFDVATWMLVAFACTSSTYLNARIVAWIVGAQQVGILIGHLCATFLEGSNIVSDVLLFLIPLYLFLFASVVLVKMCSDALTDEEGAVSDSHDSDGPKEDHALDGSLNAFARQYGLTKRELEVLGFIVQGRSVPYIAQALTLSDNTVKTHIRHVYAKGDIHSRQELLDLISGEKNAIGRQ